MQANLGYRAKNSVSQCIYRRPFLLGHDLLRDGEPKLKIQPNSFTDWILKEQGKDAAIITTFQRYTDDKLMPQ